jgi:hypothetical protein
MGFQAHLHRFKQARRINVPSAPNNVNISDFIV